jgi:hypothetical protein
VTETFVDCGRPLDEEDHEFGRKLDAMGDLLHGTSVVECLGLLSTQAGLVIGGMPVDLRPQALLDFLAEVSVEVATADDEEVPDGPIN